MDQLRAGQAMYAARCGPADAAVVDVIERTLLASAQRRLAVLASSSENQVASRLEADLAAKKARLRDGTSERERERLTARIEDARTRSDAHSVVRLSLERDEIDALEKDVRVLPMRIGKERKLAAEELRAAQAASATVRADAEHVAATLFSAGYFPDVWAGREHLLPPGVPSCDRGG